MQNIPTIGWIVIAFVAILIFIVLLKHPPKIKLNDKSVDFQQLSDKIETVKQEVSDNEAVLLDDKITQQELYNIIKEIDQKLHADHKRNLRELKLKMLKTPELSRGCQYAELITIQAILDNFYNAVEYNQLKNCLTPQESSNYKKDLLHKVKQKYKTLSTISKPTPCVASDRKKWEEIEPLIISFINEWETATIKAIKNRIEQKIRTYKAYRGKFSSPYYKKIAIEKPLEKNYNYLKKLKGVKK